VKSEVVWVMCLSESYCRGGGGGVVDVGSH